MQWRHRYGGCPDLLQNWSLSKSHAGLVDGYLHRPSSRQSREVTPRQGFVPYHCNLPDVHARPSRHVTSCRGNGGGG